MHLPILTVKSKIIESSVKTEIPGKGFNYSQVGIWQQGVISHTFKLKLVPYILKL